MPARGGGRVAVLEILVMTARLQEFVSDPTKLELVQDAIAEGEYYGMQTFDQHLLALYREGRIEFEAALAAATSPTTCACRSAPPASADRAAPPPRRPRARGCTPSGGAPRQWARRGRARPTGGGAAGPAGTGSAMVDVRVRGAGVSAERPGGRAPRSLVGLSPRSAGSAAAARGA